MASEWHDRADLPVDRARQIAQTYRRIALDCNRAATLEVDKACFSVKEFWIDPGYAARNENDLVLVEEAADLCGRSVSWVYAWIAEDRDARVKSRNPTMVRLGDVWAAVAERRQGRRGCST